MYSLNQVNKLVSCGRDPARSLPLWRGFLLIPLILVCFAFAPNAQTVLPAPDPQAIPARQHGRRPKRPFQQHNRLGNSAFGWFSIAQNFRGSFNTGAGAGTLGLNRADANTARWRCCPAIQCRWHPKHSCVERPRWSITQAMSTIERIIQRCCRRLCAQRQHDRIQ